MKLNSVMSSMSERRRTQCGCHRITVVGHWDVISKVGDKLVADSELGEVGLNKFFHCSSVGRWNAGGEVVTVEVDEPKVAEVG